MDRRRMLKMLGITAGAVAGAGVLGRTFLLPPSRSTVLEPVDVLAVRLFEALDPETRRQACVDYDHPLRQYHNRGVSCGGAPIDWGNFSREERRILTDLLHAGLSEAGRERLPNQFFINWPGVHLMNLTVCGDPTRGPYQILLSGPHLNLRLGGRSREGVAFGGPQVYGDQRGNYRQGLPGNVYRYQFETGDRLFRSLDPRRREAAVLADSPIQTQVELQGRDGDFPGVAVRELSRGSKAIVTELIDGILSTYGPEDVDYARRCLDENDGIDGLHLSYYREGEVNGSGRYQIFRLEGPAAVLYFRGYPHVHAFINIGMDGDRPLSVGEVLGENPAPLEGLEVKRLFEAALRHHTGADLALYPAESVVGRLRPGIVRTGDLYNLESWQERIVTAEILGREIRGELLAEARRGVGDPDPGKVYTVATTNWAAGEAGKLGRIAARRSGILLRDAAIAYVREHGFAGAA